MMADELWSAMHGVAIAAKRDNVEGGLREFGNIANRNLELWRSNDVCLVHFSRTVLWGPLDLRQLTSKLPECTALACWRLIRLLEYNGVRH